MEIWALIPVKPLAESKTRLALALKPPDRVKLVRAMLHHTLQVLGRVRKLGGVAVVTPDVAVSALAIEYGARVLHEPCAPGLNASLSWATTHLRDAGAGGVLVIPGDLPLLREESVEALLAAATSPGVVVSPDRHRQGTNALLVAPPSLIPYRFGRDSFQRHQDAATAAGVKPVVVETPDLAADVDLPEDLSVVEAMR